MVVNHSRARMGVFAKFAVKYLLERSLADDRAALSSANLLQFFPTIPVIGLLALA